jgi:hypothetical protein
LFLQRRLKREGSHRVPSAIRQLGLQASVAHGILRRIYGLYGFNGAV